MWESGLDLSTPVMPTGNMADAHESSTRYLGYGAVDSCVHEGANLAR